MESHGPLFFLAKKKNYYNSKHRYERSEKIEGGKDEKRKCNTAKRESI